MWRVVLLWFCLLLFGCATDQNLKSDSAVGVTFETGKSREVVLNTIMEIVIDEGYDVDPITEGKVDIVCKPRVMLSGILLEKTEGKKWIMQSKRATMNYQILLSAHVSERGIVQLKAVVIDPGFAKSVDRQKSEKLAEYYERKIKKKLRTPHARDLPYLIIPEVK